MRRLSQTLHTVRDTVNAAPARAIPRTAAIPSPQQSHSHSQTVSPSPTIATTSGAPSFFASQSRVHGSPALPANAKQAREKQTRSFSTTQPNSTNPYRLVAMMYGVLGKLKDYSKARVGNSSSLFAWVSEIAPEIAITHAIDVGCAQGNASVAIAQNHPRARVLALDTDPNSATFIRKKISAQRDFNVGGETLRGPGRITPVTGTLGQALASGDCQPGSQDFVMADAVIPYMEDAALRTFLADCHTVLKEGGLVAIGGYGHLHGFDKKTGNEDQIHCRSDVDLARMLQGLGFTVLAASNKLESQGGATLEQRLDGAELDSATDWRETLPEGVDAGVNYWHSVKVLAWKNSSAIDDALAGRFAPV